jgi:hypothetical protein
MPDHNFQILKHPEGIRNMSNGRTNADNYARLADKRPEEILDNYRQGALNKRFLATRTPH